ncbi:hypothetical protein ACFYWX_38560 [Streptomyces sp. NPDC002888]|uniref:hypothetical protein n=1 Tax=Streptomyces sp. NPDC002888 TaxID=3364668 RepID=UPI00369440C7
MGAPSARLADMHITVAALLTAARTERGERRADMLQEAGRPTPSPSEIRRDTVM